MLLLFYSFVSTSTDYTRGIKNANEKVKMEDLIKMALQWLVMAWGSHFLILNIVAIINIVITFNTINIVVVIIIVMTII